jgi:hypothetical protein
MVVRKSIGVKKEERDEKDNDGNDGNSVEWSRV